MMVMATQRSSVAESTGSEATISGFSIPEVDENGDMKWRVMGESARLKPTGGPIDITKVRLEMYKNARVDMVLTSPRCLFDREKREAETDAPVEITGRSLVITGDGFFWSGTNNLLVIRNNARVIVSDMRAITAPGTHAPNQSPNTETPK
jgi:hypothetical protein